MPDIDELLRRCAQLQEMVNKMRTKLALLANSMHDYNPDCIQGRFEDCTYPDCIDSRKLLVETDVPATPRIVAGAGQAGGKAST